MTMPEAAMHEDDSAILRQNQVWSTVNICRMEPEAETARMQRLPQDKLGLRVLAPDPGHHPGAGLLIHDICHVRPGFRLNA
jgi:hypothetical protein